MSFSPVDENTKALLAKDVFVEALDTPRVQDKVRVKELATLRQAWTSVMKLEFFTTRVGTTRRHRTLGKLERYNQVS